MEFARGQTVICCFSSLVCDCVLYHAIKTRSSQRSPHSGCGGGERVHERVPSYLYGTSYVPKVPLQSIRYIDPNITVMSVAQEVEAANAQYAASFSKGDLALPPQRYDCR